MQFMRVIIGNWKMRESVCFSRLLHSSYFTLHANEKKQSFADHYLTLIIIFWGKGVLGNFLGQ